MPNPQFDVIFASDRAIIRPISEANYKIGWNHLGSANVQTDDHDFVMKLQDEKMKWLYDAVGFGPTGNINLPDNNTIDADANNNVMLACAGGTIVGFGSNRNIVFGSAGTDIEGSNNYISNSNGSEITGSDNAMLNSSGTVLEGDGNFIVATASQNLAGVSDCFFIASNGMTATGTNDQVIVAMSDGVDIANSGNSSVIGSSSAELNGASNSAIMFTQASCIITNSIACIVDTSNGGVITDSIFSRIESSVQCTINGFDNVTIVSSQNVVARKSNTFVMGFGPSAPNVAHIKIELDAETGNAFFAGTMDVADLTIGGTPITSRLNNLTATTNPTVNDDSGDGYEPLSMWVNTVTSEIYTAISVAPGAANWQLATLTVDQLGNLALINGTTVGQNLAQLANPSAIRFLRVNADNSVSSLDASTFRTAIGLGSSATIASDTAATNNTIVQRTANASVAANFIVTSSSVVPSGVDSIAYLMGSDDSADTNVGRISFGSIANTLREYGMSSVDGDGILTWNKTGAPVQRLRLPFNGSSTGGAFQTTVTNGNTDINVLPNGTALIATISMNTSSSVGNGSTLKLAISSTEAKLESGITSAGTYRPFNIYTNGSVHSTFALDGSINLAKTGAKITGPMSSATLTDNLSIQSSTANGFTVFNVIPNGTSVIAGFNIFGSSDLANTNYLGISSQTSDFRISTGNLGSGVLKPISIRMGVTRAIDISTAGDSGFGVTSPTTACKLQTSNGIHTGNTANANASVFDWYEEGTFTPVIIGASTAGVGTYSTQTGTFTRKGNVVTISINLAWSAHTGTGDMLITGLPFTSGSAFSPLSVRYDNFLVGASKQLCAQVQTGGVQLNLTACDPAGGAAASVQIDTAGTSLRLAGSYFV